MSNKQSPLFNPEDLPEKQSFIKKEVYQYPQPAGTGKALDTDEKKHRMKSNEKESQRTSKEEGLNEERRNADAGTFEGFKDQQSDS